MVPVWALSATASLTAVSVIVCGVLQLEESNSTELALLVIWLLLLIFTVTELAGLVVSTIV